MSIKRTFNGISILKPGAYSKIIVENLTGFPLQATGFVGIVGEAQGGEPRVIDILEKADIQAAKARYKSGPIADALELLVNPSKDPRIATGASKIVVYKVNNSTQSALPLKNAALDTIVNLLSANYGADENTLNAILSVGQVVDGHAAISGSVAGDFAVSNGQTLILKANGVTYTFTNTLVGTKTAAEVMAELNTAARWSGSNKPVIASVVNTSYVKITLDPTVVTGGELDYGYLSVDATSTLDTVLGITGEGRGQKGSRFGTFKKGSLTETTLELGGASVMSVKYVGAGTLAKLSVKVASSQLVLSTDVTGAASDNLSIVLRDAEGHNKFTVKELVDQINALPAYEATVLYSNNPDLNAQELDFYNDLIISDVAAVLKRDVEDMVDWINTYSQLVAATKVENVYKAIATFSTPTFFTGAGDGSASNTDWANGFEALKHERINVVVPLLSQDKGSVTIDSVNALAVSHAIAMWAPDGKSERHAFVSKLCSKADLKAASRALQSGFASVVGQDVQVLNKAGDLTWLEPWGYACILAGLRCGADVGEPLTYKLLNVNGMRVRDGSWNPKLNFNEMIDAGVWISEPLDTGGWRNVCGNTTYGVDENFVWNRESVVQAAGFVAYDLRYNLELQFTGTKARTGTAVALANFIKARMSIYLGADITVGDDLNKGLGFKNLRVQIEGSTAIINVSVTPVQGVDFILPTIYLADIRQSA